MPRAWSILRGSQGKLPELAVTTALLVELLQTICVLAQSGDRHDRLIADSLDCVKPVLLMR